MQRRIPSLSQKMNGHKLSQPLVNDVPTPRYHSLRSHVRDEK